MAGTSGCIPDFEVNVFGQLCQPARHPTAMPGASGCVPDFEVNVFGQLCRPANRPFTEPSPEDHEPDVDAEGQANDAPVSSTSTTDHVPTSDQISEVFQKNQKLIKSLSGGNVENYIATVKNEFKEVRQSRTETRADSTEGQKTAVVHQDCPCVDYLSAETREAELQLRSEERCQLSEGCRYIEQERDQEQYEPRCRSQSHHSSSAHRFVVRHYEQDEDVATLFRQEQSERRGGVVSSHMGMWRRENTLLRIWGCWLRCSWDILPMRGALDLI